MLFDAEVGKAGEASASTDLKAADPGAEPLAGAYRAPAETLQVGNGACLHGRDELQQGKGGKGRDGEQGHAFDDAATTAGTTQQPRRKRQYRRDHELGKD